MAIFKLPDGLRDGEIEAEEIWGGCAGGRPEYKLAGGFTLLAPAGEPLERVKPSLPEEPPSPAVVHALMPDEDEPWVFESNAPAPNGDHWYTPGREYAYPWAALCTRGTPVPLVSDPFAEPVELPWKGSSVHGSNLDVAYAGGIIVDIGDWGGCGLTAEVARDMARALWAAADQAERAS